MMQHIIAFGFGFFPHISKPEMSSDLYFYSFHAQMELKFLQPLHNAPGSQLLPAVLEIWSESFGK